MSLVLVVAVVWAVVILITMALLRMAVIADEDAERHAREQRLPRVRDPLGEPAASSRRFARSRERSVAGR